MEFFNSVEAGPPERLATAYCGTTCVTTCVVSGKRGREGPKGRCAPRLRSKLRQLSTWVALRGGRRETTGSAKAHGPLRAVRPTGNGQAVKTHTHTPSLAIAPEGTGSSSKS